MLSARSGALVCVAVFCSTMVNTAFALTCYVCSSTNSTGAQCDDPFSAGSLATVNCAGGSCYKTKSAVTVTFIVTVTSTTYDRGCWPAAMTAACETTSMDVIIGSAKETDCYCSTDMCNAATTRRGAAAAVAAAAAAAAAAAMLLVTAL